MQWDIGIQGLGTLLLLAVAFGLFAQVLFLDRELWWVGLLAGGAFFLAGVLISEGLFGWATAEELQPNIDGLSFDEVLVLFLVGVPVLLVARYLARDRIHRHSAR